MFPSVPAADRLKPDDAEDLGVSDEPKRGQFGSWLTWILPYVEEGAIYEKLNMERREYANAVV